MGKINVDGEPALAVAYNVSPPIPALILFKDGRLEKTSICFRPKEQVEALFK